jgi:hypothetical protein
MPFQPKPAVLSREQRQIWRRLCEYIHQERGFVVSQPDCSPIRFEVALDSELPQLLTEAGHKVRSIGTHERLTPSVVTETRGTAKVTRTIVGPGVVGVWLFELPSLTKPSTVAG